MIKKVAISSLALATLGTFVFGRDAYSYLCTGVQSVRDTLGVDIVGINDIRIIDVIRDPKDPNAGSFVITTTKVTMPSLYDLVASGPVMLDGITEEIYAKPIRMEVTEFKSNEATSGNSGSN